MKKNILLLTIITLIVSACKKDKEEVLLKSARIIRAFQMENQIGVVNRTYSIDSGTIKVWVKPGSPLTNVKPIIEISDQASILPASGAAVNFALNTPFNYTVTGQSGLALPWYITVKEYVPPAIVSFTTPGVLSGAVFTAPDGAEPGKVTVYYKPGSNITKITPIISTTADVFSISPASGAMQNFTTPVTYTLTHNNRETTTWVVTFVAYVVPAT